MNPPATLLLDFLAARTGGQLTRARAFLERVRAYDPDTRLHLLHADGALAFAAGRADLTLQELHFAAPGIALRRVAWQNMRLGRVLAATGARAYLTFSHDLPTRFPRGVPAIVGVSNLAPFSAAAREAETRLAARLRLDLLARTIVSSARRAQAVIALSDTCRALLIERGVAAARIEVIPNGVAVEPPPADPVQRAQVLDRFGVRPGYLLYVSHFYRYKNFERLVAAFAALAPALRGHTQLVLVGRPWDAGYHQAIAAQVNALGLASSVRVIPGAGGADLATLYAGARLFVFPSLIENSPNILLEAMAYGLPVLASNLAPMPEFGADAIDYFDPMSVDDLRAAIERALAATADPLALAEAGARSRARAAEFTWDRFTARVVALYQSVLR
jgi:glycosyltransferase involved in cell wall biosynthesis